MRRNGAVIAEEGERRGDPESAWAPYVPLDCFGFASNDGLRSDCSSSDAEFGRNRSKLPLAALDIERLRRFYRGLGGFGATQRRAGKMRRGGSHGATLFQVAVAMQDDVEAGLDHRGRALFERDP